jgi:hypothetical protein
MGDNCGCGWIEEVEGAGGVVLGERRGRDSSTSGRRGMLLEVCCSIQSRGVPSFVCCSTRPAVPVVVQDRKV